MAPKSSRTNGWTKNGIVKLKVVAEKLLPRSLSHSKSHDFDYDKDSSSVPEDVKVGHFAVMAVNDGETKRFIVPLSYLTHPAFRKLLEHAEEEFGFDPNGALKIPCRSSDLERILVGQLEEDEKEEKKMRDADNIGWETCKSSMVQSC